MLRWGEKTAKHLKKKRRKQNTGWGGSGSRGVGENGTLKESARNAGTLVTRGSGACGLGLGGLRGRMDATLGEV